MKRLAILAITALAVITAPGVALAQQGAADTAARYAWLKACPKKDYEVPCGPWTVTLRNGKQQALPDAQVFPVMANGKVQKEWSSWIALSGDGRKVTYIRKSDHRLVVRDLAANKAVTLPGDAGRIPKGISTGDVGMLLSGDGNVVGVSYFDEKKHASWIVDMAGRTAARLPKSVSVEAISPSGKYVLTSRYTKENITEYAVYDTAGVQVNSQVVPQIVANNGPLALADDGGTVALIVDDGKGGRTLRTYDLAQDTVADPVKVPLSKKDFVNRLQWQSDGRLKLWTTSEDSNYVTVSASSWWLDTDTGATKRIDTLKIKSKLWNWRLPGT